MTSKEDCENEAVHVSLSFVGGHEYEVLINAAADVWSLKRQISKEKGIPKQNQVLLLGGDVVKSDSVLGDLMKDGVLCFTLIITPSSCLYCGKQNDLKRCSACDSYYCNSFCQRTDWSRHRDSGRCGLFMNSDLLSDDSGALEIPPKRVPKRSRGLLLRP